MSSFLMQASINTATGPLELSLGSGSVTLVVGPNGVGKSAFLQQIYRSFPADHTSYYPGHRQITFSHGWDNMQMPLADLDNNLFAQMDGFNRYKSIWPEEQFKSVLRRIQNSESAYNQDILKRIETGEDARSLVALRESPMQILNNIFRSARMAVSFKLTENGITAVRDEKEFSIDRLSDGERAALFLSAAIINQHKQGLVIIDEPERHLHPSISAPLVSSAVRSRPNHAFVFATHDLNLIETLTVDNFVYIKNSTVVIDRPETRVFDIAKLHSLSDITQDLKRDILGVRDKVMFVEGDPTSLDMPLYSAYYPEWKVAPRGGHEKVQEAVKALNDNADLHWMQVVGIIDGDGRGQAEVDRLKSSKIITLPLPSIENLFFLREVVEQMARLYESIDGTVAELRLKNIQTGLPEYIQRNLSDIVCRRTAWAVNRNLSELKISTNDVRNGIEFISGVSVLKHKADIESDLNLFLGDSPSLDHIASLPIKATGIPMYLAQGAGADSLKRYKQTVLHQLDINSVYGQAIRKAFAKHLPVLP